MHTMISLRLPQNVYNSWGNARTQQAELKVDYNRKDVNNFIVLVVISTFTEKQRTRYCTSNMTTVTEVRSASVRLFAGECYYNTYYVAISFHRRVWYRALSLCYACIRSSGIILIP